VSAAAESGSRVYRVRDGTGVRDLRTNSVLAILVLLLVAIIPLPLGGNRPSAVAAASIYVFAVGGWYALRLGWRQTGLRIGVADLWLPAVLLSGFVAYAVVQALPLGPFVRETPAGPVSSPALSLAPGATGALALQFIAYGVFGLLAMQAGARERRAVAVLDWIFGVIVAYAALGLFMFLHMGDTFFGVEKTYYEGSLTGTFINRNSNATFLAFGLAAGSAMLTEALGPQARRFSMRPLVLAGGLVLIGIALLATNSRMGIAAGLAGAVLALVTGAIRARFSVWKWGGLLALMAAGAAWIAPEFGGAALDRFLELDASLGSRMELYRQVATMIAADPWFGFGGGAFEWVFPLFNQPPLSADVVWDRAHSTYLGLWSEFGLVAGSVPLVIVAILAVGAAIGFWRSENGWSVPLAGLAVVAVAALHSTVDFSLEMPANAYVLLAVLGIGAASRMWAAGRRSAG
jgi:O-antigen ligase